MHFENKDRQEDKFLRNIDNEKSILNMTFHTASRENKK